MRLTNIIMFFAQSLFLNFFTTVYIYNVLSILSNVAETDVENDNVASTLSNVAQINVEIDNADLRLSDVATPYQFKNNVETTLKCLLGY